LHAEVVIAFERRQSAGGVAADECSQNVVVFFGLAD